MVQKQRLFPAVLGLEAMAQAAMALIGSTRPPNFEKVTWMRPIAVPERAPNTIRVAALRRAADLVEVCLRSEETDYAVDHFRAFCHFDVPMTQQAPRAALSLSEMENVALNPRDHLYGHILFHQGRFCQVDGYRLLKAKECIAEISDGNGTNWFGPYLPREFVLGDPAARDAALHAIQACIPHHRILPTGIDRLVVEHAPDRRRGTPIRFVRARETQRNGNSFIYDVELADQHGQLIERWEGLHLRAVEGMAPREAWPEPLLAPYLERRLQELIADLTREFGVPIIDARPWCPDPEFAADGHHLLGTGAARFTDRYSREVRPLLTGAAPMESLSAPPVNRFRRLIVKTSFLRSPAKMGSLVIWKRWPRVPTQFGATSWATTASNWPTGFAGNDRRTLAALRRGFGLLSNV